jgi:uncharacterized protein (TIGR00270 family)
MYVCELCGEPTDQKIIRKIEGVKMLVCRNCMMMGEKPQSERKSSHVQSSGRKYYSNKPEYSSRSKPPRSVRKSKPVSRGPRNLPIDRLKLVDNYRNLLKKVRNQNNMDQGEFSNSVGITHTSYRHIESGKLELTIQEAKKIEKKYEIVLTEFIEDPEEDEYEQYLSSKGSGATLGDVYIKKKK